MSEILLKASEALDAAAKMKTSSETAQREMESVRARLTALQGSFKGSTAVAFEARFADWKKSSDQLMSALNGLGDFLKGAAEAIEKLDQDISNKLKG
jgi:WXG100 family type VII secretion target